MGLQICSPPVTISRQRVAHINRLSDPPAYVLANGSKVTFPPLIAAHIGPGDDVSFPLPNSSTAIAEIYDSGNGFLGKHCAAGKSGLHTFDELYAYRLSPRRRSDPLGR
jgi:hypothetical protein